MYLYVFTYGMILIKEDFMKKMYIYEGAMCCSTGVCGPSPDEELMRVSSLVDKLTNSGASIERYNLTNNTKEFVENKTINSLLNEKGEGILPVVMVDNEVVMTGKYPSNEEFYEMLFLSDEAKEDANSDDGSCCSGGGCCC